MRSTALRERYLELTFKSERVAYRSFGVVTRKMEPLDRVISQTFAETGRAFVGADFTCKAAPSRPIEGTVRDAKTGRPIPGVDIESYILADNRHMVNIHVLKTTSDAQGRFHLAGMPLGKGNDSRRAQR